MATATKEQKGNVTVVTLAGSIDEADDFSKLIGTPQGGLQVKCKGVTRINSMGVKSWIKYFTSLVANKISVQFFEVTTPLVENANMVQNFIPKDSVFSVMAPYRCPACNTNLVAEMKTEDVTKSAFNPPALKCPKCAKPAEFDDMPDEFFAFMKN